MWCWCVDGGGGGGHHQISVVCSSRYPSRQLVSSGGVLTTLSSVSLLLLRLRSQAVLDVQSNVEDEARRLHQGGHRSPQLLREVHSFGLIFFFFFLSTV